MHCDPPNSIELLSFINILHKSTVINILWENLLILLLESNKAWTIILKKKRDNWLWENKKRTCPLLKWRVQEWIFVRDRWEFSQNVVQNCWWSQLYLNIRLWQVMKISIIVKLKDQLRQMNALTFPLWVFIKNPLP